MARYGSVDFAGFLDSGCTDDDEIEPPDEAPVHGLSTTDRSTRMAASRRRRRRGRSADTSGSIAGLALGAFAALATTVISLAFWASATRPLRDIEASPMTHDLSHIWPVVVYGPWVAACVSSLLGARHRRKRPGSWTAAVLFSGAATSLSSRDVAGIPSDMILAGLPPIAAAISLHQFLAQANELTDRCVRQRRHRRT